MTLQLGTYTSVPEYIYGITREIWEDRGVGGKLQQTLVAIGAQHDHINHARQNPRRIRNALAATQLAGRSLQR